MKNTQVELREVFRFMAGIVATHSKEISESIVESFASVVNLSDSRQKWLFDAPEIGFTLYRRMQAFFRNHVHRISSFIWQES